MNLDASTIPLPIKIAMDMDTVTYLKIVQALTTQNWLISNHIKLDVLYIDETINFGK